MLFYSLLHIMCFLYIVFVGLIIDYSSKGIEVIECEGTVVKKRKKHIKLIKI